MEAQIWTTLVCSLWLQLSFDVSEVKVFPSPAAEHIFISGLLGTSKVEIFSVSGAKVFEKTINEDQMIPIDFETWNVFCKNQQ